MGTWCSKPSVSHASSCSPNYSKLLSQLLSNLLSKLLSNPLFKLLSKLLSKLLPKLLPKLISKLFSKLRTRPAASVLAKDERDSAIGSSGVLVSIPPNEATDPLKKPLHSTLSENGGDAERIKDIGNGGVPDTTLINDDGQSELRSPLVASVLAKDERDGAIGSLGVLVSIPPNEATDPLKKPLPSTLPENGGDAERIKDIGNGGVPDTTLINDDGQSELCSLLIASVLAKDERDGAIGSLGVLVSIPPNEATDPLKKPLPFALPENGGDAKRIEDIGNGGVLDIEEPETRLFSCQPWGAASEIVLGPSGSKSLFELDEAKHKIFLSHSGAQKDFVEQLCVDLEHKGYFFPFFDQRHHSLPKGEDFAPLIIKAAQLCHVAVIVLSKEFLCSKWPMIELAEFHAAQQNTKGGGGKLKLLPLFFKLSIEEVKDEGRWMPKWKEHGERDDRIDLSKWSAAVKALCKINGLKFGKDATTEVNYRKCIVENIFQLSPPLSLFGSSESTVGSDRMCKAISTQFVKDTTFGEYLLGIYGTIGLGKSMLAKALHDYFYREFFGKVCYIDMGHKSRVWRQKTMLKMLCDFEKDVLDYIGDDVEKGLMQMKTFMKRNPVFLIFDNITNNALLLQEVRDYLRVEFHPMSRILITSRSKAILEDLLPNMEFYTPMPALTFEEAKELFLKYAAPEKAISRLTSEEHNILEFCVEKCLVFSQEGEFYHPLVLIALAYFLFQLGRAKENWLLVWKNHLVKEMDLMKDILNSSKYLFDALNLQFSTFDFTEKLILLDLALFSRDPNYEREGSSYQPCDLGWLCRLYDKSPTFMEIKLSNLVKFGVIDVDSSKSMGYVVTPLYQEFAKWYAMDHNVNELKTAWGVFQAGGMNSRGDSWTPIKNLSNLIRLRISPMTCANVRLVASKRMQELSNLVVLQLVNCHDLTSLNLEGLDYLRELELTNLPKLETITFSKNSSKDEDLGIYNSLQHVQLRSLVSLVHMLDFRRCTSLHSIVMKSSEGMKNLEEANCRCVKNLTLNDVSPNHFGWLLQLECLQSLEYFWSDVESEVKYFEVQWRRRVNESDTSVQVAFEGEGPFDKFLKELWLLLDRSNDMICTHFREVDLRER